MLKIGLNVYKELCNSFNSYTCLNIEKIEGVDIVADIQDIPRVDSDSFDMILCAQVLEHLLSPQDAVYELHRKLKPDGILLLQCKKSSLKVLTNPVR